MSTPPSFSPLPQPRTWRGLLLLAAIISALSLGVWIGRHSPPSSAAVRPAASDTYQFFDTLVDIRQQIRANYVENVDDKKLMQGAIDGMLAQLDPYSNYFSKEELAAFDKQTTGKFSGIGAEMAQDPNTGAFLVISPLEDSPALKAGMLAGDRIVKVNGEALDNMNLRDLISRIAGLPGTEVKITVIHEGDKTPTELTIKRAVVQVHSIKGYKLANGDGKWDYLIDPAHRLAYVRITNFTDTTDDDLDKALLPLFNSREGLRGIVLDLRFNPGGLLQAGIEVADRFLESGAIVSTKGRDGRNREEAQARREGTYPRVPVVVLVNEYSASAAEIVAGALKDHKRALLIGTRTFGKGSVQNLITLGGGESALKLTTAYYYLPSGRNIAKRKDATVWGVDPDSHFVIHMSDDENRALLRARRDSEIIRAHPATAPATTTGTTKPATTQEAFSDRQLAAALDVLVANAVFTGLEAVPVITSRPSATASLPAVPPTAPASKPATVPAPSTTPTPSTAPATTPAPTDE